MSCLFPTHAGCEACDCVASGSLSLQCDMISGVCDCRQNATGYQCELCALGTFGLPTEPCQGMRCAALCNGLLC